MNQRDLAFASLQRRIYQAAVSADPRMLLDESAAGDARSLQSATDPGTDTAAAHVLGWFHWLRYLTIPDQDARAELSAALSLLAPVYGRNPYAVPEPLQQWYLRAETDSYLGRHRARPAGWLGSGQAPWPGQDRLPAFHAAVYSITQAASADPRGRDRFLADVALMLRGIAGRADDEAILAEVADVTAAAFGHGPPGLPSRAALSRPSALNSLLEPIPGPVRADASAAPFRLASRVPRALPPGEEGAPALGTYAERPDVRHGTVGLATYAVAGEDRYATQPGPQPPEEGAADRTVRRDWNSILGLRRRHGEDLWPDDGISDEDYWAAVARGRPLGPGDRDARYPRRGTGGAHRADGPARIPDPGYQSGQQLPAGAAGPARDAGPGGSRWAALTPPRADARPGERPGGLRGPDTPVRTEDAGRRGDAVYGAPYPSSGELHPGRAAAGDSVAEDPLASRAYAHDELADTADPSYRIARRRKLASPAETPAQGYGVDGYGTAPADGSPPTAAQPAWETRNDQFAAWPAGRGYPAEARPVETALRYLSAQLPERVGVGARIPLLVWIATARGSATATALKPFALPGEGRAIIITVSAPGFELSTDADQELSVPAAGDSDPIRFGLRAVIPGLHRVQVDAFAAGTFLGRLELQVSAEIGGPLTEGAPRQLELSRVTSQPGEVTLQVNRENGAYSFQLIGTSWYERVLTRSLTADPTEVVERILSELRSVARGESGFTSPAAVRERIKNLGTGLWSDIVPDAIRRQFWEQADNIGSLVVMSNLDTVPWELLHAVDRDSPDLGFLAEHVPVVRRVYERAPAYRLPLPSAAYVVPPQSPSDAAAEVSDLRAILGGRVRDLGVVSRLDELQGMFAAPPGLLHFACHNSFSPAEGSVVRMDSGSIRPIDLEQSKRRETMAAASPLVFFNACRTAGEIYGFTQMSGWASQFMAAGAGAFIGTLWPVRTRTARQFATAFYDAVVRGNATLGEASLLARKSVSHDLEDPTWLAYTVYGSPAARAAG
jgi:CHAT domain